MNRRKFVSTVPVLASGMTYATPLLAVNAGTTGEATQQDLLKTFRQQVETSITDINGVSGSMRHLYTPSSRPKLVGDRLHFTNQCGDMVTLFRKNDQVMAKFG